MKTSIICITYAKDIEFFEYCLRSYKKYASGFFEFVVVVPDQDLEVFRSRFSNNGLTIKSYPEMPGKGMVHHELQVMYADHWCDGDFILHVDSDVLFWEPCSPSDFFVGGKPILLRERFEDFRDYAARFSWKKCVSDATGIDPEWETMVRHPAVHPRWIYHEVREAIAKHTKKPVAAYVLSCRNEFPQTFAEYPTLGAYAIEHFPDAYHWVDFKGTFKYEHGRDKVRAFWSHGGVAPVINELNEIVK